MALSFRRRLFLGLVGLGTLPLAAALLVLALQIRTTASPAGMRAALDEIAASGRTTIAALDTASLGDSAREALRSHSQSIARRTSLARQAETLSRTAAGALAVVILLVAVVVVVISLAVARRLSSVTSAPIEELVRWTRRIERREPLPAVESPGGAPELGALRRALRDMAVALDDARRQELERERLQAFRETARRVAHEMRGPLSAARLALRQIPDTVQADPESASPFRVLGEETARLERMAQEFSEFGRLTEGPTASVDIGALVDSVLTATVPEHYPVDRSLTPDLAVNGHYEALRRALQNLVRNAVEASDERGIAISAAHDPGDPSAVLVTVTDRGPGVPAEQRERIFEPYVTTKAGGTGLGLALVRQTVVAHGGRVEVAAAEGGGAVFRVHLPAESAR